MKNGNFELEVCLGADTKPLRQYGHDGRTFVEGKPGTEFTLVFRNHSSDRIEVVPSVDGLSVMDGKPATEASEGYVVEPYRRTIIRGWRTSMKDSAKFVFEPRGKGYAEQKGQGATGVVGVLVFKEKEHINQSILRKVNDLERQVREARMLPPVVYPVFPVYPQDFPLHYPPMFVGDPYPWTTTTITCGRTDDGMDSGSICKTITGSDIPDAVCQVGLTNQAPYTCNLSVGWGNQQADAVTEVNFIRGLRVCEMEIQYNDRAALEALGIRFEAEVAVPAYPSAFRRDFCEPPKK